MSRLSTLRFVIALLVLFLGAVTPVLAQDRNEPGIPLEVLEGRLRVGGDKIRFCLNSASTLLAFDRAVAAELAASLLLEADFYELQSPGRTVPYDFRLHLSRPELYVEMTNNCDALVGFVASPAGFPDWLTITRPYYTSRFVLAATGQDLADLSDLPGGASIGTRLGSSGDIALVSYRGLLASETGWSRRPYADNGTLVEALLNGSAEAIYIWEPALYRALDGDPASKDISQLAHPFSSPEIALSIAVWRDDTYLRDLLDQAIEAAMSAGLIDKLRQMQGLP